MLTWLYTSVSFCCKVSDFVTKHEAKRPGRKFFALIISQIHTHSYYMKGCREHFIIPAQRTLEIDINGHLKDTVRPKNIKRLESE
jgi:hypothetical protein